MTVRVGSGPMEVPDENVKHKCLPVSKLKNQVQLSTYADHIGDNLQDLRVFMEKHLKGYVSGLHLLPVYPSSGDGGFAPINYNEVDPKFGTWEDVRLLSLEYELCMEFMVNHLSPQSPQFQDFLAKGDASEYADMFVDWNKVWKGEPRDEDLKLILSRRNQLPVIEVKLNSGETRQLWCTFGPQQIDINPFSVPGRKFVKTSLQQLFARGIKLVRLDAFGYVTKKPGTRCFFNEPEVWDLLDDIAKEAEETGIKLLCEVHEEYETNIKLASRGYCVYDFALPLLILHAFTFHTACNLRHWLNVCPRDQVTVLDTHDGMGIDDIAGLADVADVDELAKVVSERLGCSPTFKYRYDTEARKYYKTPHQYNCTYFHALRGNARHYLLARAIQFFTPGIPMVYYVGLLAGLNDYSNVKDVRDVNRHRYTLEEAEAAIEQPVVKALLKMCRFRNIHPAFNGQMTVCDLLTSPNMLITTWTNGLHTATLKADLKGMCFDVVATATVGGTATGEVHKRRYVLGDLDMSEAETIDEAKQGGVQWVVEECTPSTCYQTA